MSAPTITAPISASAVAPSGATQEAVGPALGTPWFSIQPCGDSNPSGLVVGTHTEAVALLTEHHLEPVSVADLAAQRLTLGGYHQVSWTGSRTNDFLVVDGDQYLLAHGDPAGDLWQDDTADTLAGFHARGHEIPFDADAITDAIQIDATNFEVPVSELAGHPVAQFLLGETVHDYQAWLTSLAVPYWPFMLPPASLTRHYPHPFMRPLIMRCTDNWSGIITTNTDLHTAYGYRTIAHRWTGPVAAEERFNAHQLAPVRAMLGLETCAYTLNELVDEATAAGHAAVLGVALRVLRSGSNLPANYATFAPTNQEGS